MDSVIYKEDADYIVDDKSEIKKILLNGKELSIPGAQVRCKLLGHRFHKKLHFVGLVEGNIVYRYFPKTKRWWHYGVISLEELNSWICREGVDYKIIKRR